MMKKVSACLLSMALLAHGHVSNSLALENQTQKAVEVKVDWVPINFPDTKPFIDPATNRTLIPVRFVSEKLGATVEWDNHTRTVKMDRAGKKILLKIGEKTAVVAGKKIQFDAAAMIKDERTFVPLRFISEAYGAQVVWDNINKVVYITTKQPVRDAYGMQLFKQFHGSLKIKNGMLTGKLPRKSDENLSVYGAIGYKKTKNGRNSLIMENGESFSVPISEVEAIVFSVYDMANGKKLVNFAYRNLPDLTPLDVTDL